MKELHCLCCNASLDFPIVGKEYIKCRYCNATYRIEEYQIAPILPKEIHAKLIEPGFLEVIGAEVEISDYKFGFVKKEEIEEFVREELAFRIAKKITDKLEIKEEKDYKYNTIFTSQVRIDNRKY